MLSYKIDNEHVKYLIYIYTQTADRPFELYTITIINYTLYIGNIQKTRVHTNKSL